jgi:hypothetical protein
MAMSLTGSLTPCIPIKLLLKFTPPKITMVYHFQNKSKEEFFHDTELDKKMLETASVDDICNHLYFIEPYYFDPKEVKRPQVITNYILTLLFQ